MTDAPPPHTSHPVIRRTADWIGRPLNLVTVLAVLASFAFQLAVYLDHRRWDRDVRALRGGREEWSARETAKLVEQLGPPAEGLDEAATKRLVRERLPDAAEVRRLQTPGTPGRHSVVEWSEPERGWLVAASFDNGRLLGFSVQPLARTPRVKEQLMLRATASLWLMFVLMGGLLAAGLVLLLGLWAPLRHAGLDWVAVRACTVALAGTPFLVWDNAKPWVFVMTLLVAAIALASAWLAARKQRASGRCVACNYDMRANPSGICPECGTATAAAAG